MRAARLRVWPLFWYGFVAALAMDALFGIDHRRHLVAWVLCAAVNIASVVLSERLERRIRHTLDTDPHAVSFARREG